MDKRIIVQVEGGLVQAIYSNELENLDIDVLDLDNLKEESDQKMIDFYKKLEAEIEDLKQVY